MADPGSSGGSGPAPASPSSRERAYWRRNLRYLAILLSIWFAVSYGAGILFVEPLNGLRIPGTGFPVGFWFAQQGSILVFVLLIFVYVWLMNRLDAEFGVAEGGEASGGSTVGRGEGASRAVRRNRSVGPREDPRA